MSHNLRSSAVAISIGLVALAYTTLLPAVLLAQGSKGKKAPPGPEKVSGTISAIEHKGKALHLKIAKESGDVLEVLMTPRIKLLLVGTGDPSVLMPKAIVASDTLVLANNELFGKKFAVYFGESPPPLFERDSQAEGVYHICGQVVASDGSSMLLDCGGGTTRKVSLEAEAPAEITVYTQDVDLLDEGAPVQVDGMMRGGKLIVSAVTVTLEKPLTSRDLTDDDARKGRTKTAAAKKGAKGKAKADDAAAGGGANPADPFGVLGSDDKPKPKKGSGDK